jgi:hypothetical protein
MFEGQAHNFSGTGLVIFFLPLFKQRFIPVFDHVFGPDPAKFPINRAPLAIKKFDCCQQGNVFLDGPLPSSDLGIQVVEPMLSALLERAVKFTPRATKKPIRDLPPFTQIFF